MNYKKNIVGTTELSKFTDFQLYFILDNIIETKNGFSLIDWIISLT